MGLGIPLIVLGVAAEAVPGLLAGVGWAPPLVVGVGAACVIVGVGVGAAALGPATHLALLALGQGAIWALHEDTQWHQRIADPTWVFGTELRWPGALAAAYGLAVLGLAGRALRRYRPRLPAGRIFLGCAVLSSGAALALPHISPFSGRGLLTSFAAGFAASALGALNLLLAGLAAPSEPPRWWPDLGSPRWTLRIRWGGAAGVVGLASLFALTVLHGAPSLEDDIAMSWQAKTIASGRWYLPPPPEAESLKLWLLVNDGTKWFGYSPPGWPLVLAVGFLLGVPWLINPLIGGATLVLVHRVCERLHGARIANVSAVLLAVSPWFIAMSGSWLAHPLTLLLAMLGLTLMEAGLRKWSVGAFVGVGLAIGAIAAIRTYDALVAGLPLAVWGAVRAGSWKERFGMAAAGVPAAGAMVALTLAYNQHVTGHWATFPNNLGMAVQFDVTGNVLGFGPDKGIRWPNLDPLPGHGLPDVLINGNHNLYFAHVEAVGTHAGLLGLVALAVALGLRLRREDGLWLGYVASVVGAFSCYWFSGGSDFGPKYWYVLLPATVVLLGLWGDRIRRALPEQHALRPVAPAALVAVVLLSGLHFLPWRLVDRYYHRKPCPANLAALERTHDWDNALVFVENARSENFGQAFVRNDVDFEPPGPVYARRVDPETDARLAAWFKGRQVWVIRAPSHPGEDFVVLSGPDGPVPTPR